MASSNPLQAYILTGKGASASSGVNYTGDSYPKFSFNFTVQFILRDLPLVKKGSKQMNSFDLPAKSATRPKINTKFQEANFYNFRTNVATNTEYGTGSIVFYDDGSNNAHKILKAYLNTVSPISNQTETNADNFDQNGLYDTASMTQYGTNRHGPIQAIQVIHHYRQGVAPKNTIYTYTNPKILTYDFSDLDMTRSDASEITVVFNYDSVHIKDS